MRKLSTGWRTIVLEQHERLELKNDQMILRDDDREQAIALNQIRDLVISYPSGSITLPLLKRLSEESVNVIICDSRREPMAQLIGLHQHTETAGHLMDQAEWSAKRKDAMWKSIVRNKLTMQSQLLNSLHRKEADQLLRYASGVRLGDKTNREGLGAKVYFPALFGEGFIRQAPDEINAALNYGYTILNTAMSRIVTIHGYHTALGIHHCSRDNPVNLSCDIMEPFRPLVDEIVVKYMGKELDWPYKQ